MFPIIGPAPSTPRFATGFAEVFAKVPVHRAIQSEVPRRTTLGAVAGIAIVRFPSDLREQGRQWSGPIRWYREADTFLRVWTVPQGLKVK
jgi:hypothetical protein